MSTDFEKINRKFENVKSAHFCKRFAFRGFSSAPSHCTLTLIESSSAKRIVVCSQADGRYTGTSVTNAIEIINDELRKTAFKQWCAWTPGRNFWLEHYPSGTGLLADAYTLMQVSIEAGSFYWGSNMAWRDAAKKVDVPVAALAYGFDSETGNAS